MHLVRSCYFITHSGGALNCRSADEDTARWWTKHTTASNHFNRQIC